MSHRNVRILTALSLAVLWLAVAAHAQFAPHVVKVSIPFDFTANDKPYPAGDYSLVATPGRLELRDSQNHVLDSLLPHSVESLGNVTATKVQFSTEGGGHALTRLWLQGYRQGYELSPSKAGTAVAKQRSHPPDQVSGGGRMP